MNSPTSDAYIGQRLWVHTLDPVCHGRGHSVENESASPELTRARSAGLGQESKAVIIVSAKEPGHDSIDRLGSESLLPDVEGFRRRLARQAAALRRQIADAPSRQEELRADCLLDAADVGSATAALAQHDVETDNAARLLTRVEGALVRLKDGSYGNCLQCGEAIDWERLRALPHLERCLRCESGKDGGLR